MKFLEPKLIIYDGSCGLCTSLKEKVQKFGWFPEEKIVAYQKLDPQLREKVDPNRFKNEMALIDLTGERTQYGAEGIAYLFAGKWGLVRALLKVPGFYPLYHLIYRIVAYNRFAISNPNFNLIRCSGCEPEVPTKFRLAYYGICLTLATLITLLFGASLSEYFDGISQIEGAGWMLLMAGTGWIVQGIMALLFMKDRTADYLSHLGTTMVVGVAILLPSTLWHLLGGHAHWLIPTFSVALSSGYMLYQHIRRVKFLELNQRWTASWFVSLQLTAAMAVALFLFNTLPSLIPMFT